ncbi:MAG TPA: twin-arginine translocation signal domain-containing protein [Alphaproteobacteria bacterium]|nr:twin-arginine translocation signal domain-containing protein [Alphaproteobacteria bacterium]
MKIERRKFLKLSAIAAGAVGIGGIIFYAKYRDTDPPTTSTKAPKKSLLPILAKTAQIRL